MTWFKVDDSFHSHPKALATDPAALGLWVIAGSWCGSNLTDGFVPDYVLPRLLPGCEPLAQKLTAAGLWKRAKGGYRFHDWNEYNPSAESVLAEREAAKERMRRRREEQRAKREAAAQGQNRSGEQPTNVPKDFERSSDSPTRPDPTRTSYGSTNQKTPSSGPAPRGTRIPNDFTVTPEMVTWARDRVPNVDGRLETERFVNYYRALPGAKGRKLDWPATWRNWMLGAFDKYPAHALPGHQPAPPRGTNDLKVEGGLALSDRLAAEEAS